MSMFKLQGDLERRNGIHYEVDTYKEPIGSGGMGKVYEGICVDERTGATRPVAIKFMYGDLPESAYERARRESEIQLRNDNLVEMLGFIETQTQDGSGLVSRHYHVVSELLTGVSLSDLLEGKTKDRNGEDVPFAVKMLQEYQHDSEHFARFIIMNVLSGVMALHDAGYIHRDIDPSNIMLTTEGHVKLIDFGIAKQMTNLTTGDRSLTVAGKFLGKPEYAAPELVLGDLNHQNQSTDIYAIGILLYQCIVGHTPFEGPRQEILQKQLNSKIPLDKIKNKELRRIIATACEKKQSLRYQSSAQMRVALESMKEHKSTATTKKSSKKMIMAAAAVVVMLLILLIVYLVSRHNEKVAEEKKVQNEIELREKEKREAVLNVINEKVREADNMSDKGKSKSDADHYESYLMTAFDMYVEVEMLAKNNTGVNYDLDGVERKKNELVQLLDIAHDELLGNASVLAENGDDSVADVCRQRAEKIEEFKNKLR